MKKRLAGFSKIGLLLISLMFILGACNDKTEYYESRIDWDIAYKTVYPSDWVWNWQPQNQTGYYSCTINMPQFTQSLVVDGGILVAQDLGADVYRPLPYTIYDAIDPDSAIFGQTVDYEYGVNYVTIFVTYSDLADGRPTQNMTFKITSFY